MPAIVALATAVPDHAVDQSTARAFAASLFGETLPVERLLPVFDNALVRRRHFCEAPEWFGVDHSFVEKNAAWQRHALELSERALTRVLGTAGAAPSDIDHLFFVSTTGFATPSLDAHLLNRMGLRHDLRRSPLWGLGCAGGVAGLARAADWLRAEPTGLAAVVAVELCGLTFVRGDRGRSNFVATALFADGCGAALLAGDEHPLAAAARLRVVGSAAHTWPESLDVMGWGFTGDGLHVIFSRSIPHLVHSTAREVLDPFLARHGLDVAALAALASHPGGAKVIEAYEEALGIGGPVTRTMRDVLADYGNMSSATVLFVLERLLAEGDVPPGRPVLSTALGPGFSTEMVLLETR